MSPIDDLPPLREVIKQHDLRARKSLGQNFLLDLNLTARIARAAGPLEGVTVVEVGPGPGGLTRALLATGARRVVAIERDARAIAALADIAKRYPGRLEVVEADALTFDPRSRLESGSARIVANLPYNIATALLVGWLTAEPWPPWFDRLVLMFQREVAERITAAPGSKKYGRLSVLAGWRTEARILFDVAPSAFVPPPKVTSSLVELVPRRIPLPCRVHRPAKGHRGRLRPATQDAPSEPEIAGTRPLAAARRNRHRADRPRRGHSSRRICGARARVHGRHALTNGRSPCRGADGVLSSNGIGTGGGCHEGPSSRREISGLAVRRMRGGGALPCRCIAAGVRAIGGGLL